MNARALSAGALAASATVGLGVASLALVSAATADQASSLYEPAVVVVAAIALAGVVWLVDPAYTLSAAIFLTPLAGNWQQLGVPGALSPDRLLFAGAIVAVLLRAPPVADRPRLQISGAHWLLGLAVIYTLGSAFFAETLLERDAFLKIVDAFGILPFLIFLVAPVVFRTRRQRLVLLGTLVALGAYLGLTVLFETLKLDALVFPKYILDDDYGIHQTRGRGPFVDAVANGLALYMCSIACAIAAASWRSRPMRALALAIGLLCLVGAFLSLERSVWIGAVLGTVAAMLATRGLRRYVPHLVVTVAIAVALSLALIPGLSESVSQRANEQGTIWDRKNLARAAVNMVEAKPLLGFGWSRFAHDSSDYFEQSPDYPLTATSAGVHNTPLTYAVDLGLVGMTLWIVGLLFGVGGALAVRGPPDLNPWRVGLLALATSYLVVLNAVPPTAWPNRSLWLLAGVVYSARYLALDTSRSPEHAVQPRSRVADRRPNSLPKARIAYLMSHYPAISHAFVLREVEHLRAAGVDVETLSIHRAKAEDLLAAADLRAAATTFSVLPTSVGPLLSAHLEALMRSPRRYLATLALALRTGAPGARERLWHLFYFAEAMILLRHCRHAGIAHIHALFADGATDVAMLVTHYRRGQRVNGLACSWSLAVHGSVEFYDVTRYALASKLAHARFAVAISDFGRSQLMTLSPPERWPHIHVVRCGVDPDLFAAPVERPISDRRAEILFVGRLLHGKGLSLMFEAVAELRRRELDVVATIVGDGPARKEFEAAARRRQLSEHVRFLGSVGQDDIRRHYARADIFCLPSFAEGIPVVAIEAMAMELPLVTTRIMGIPELVDDGREGLLTPPGHVGALTEALERLVKAPDERRRIGRAARQKVERDYDITRSAERMRGVLEQELGLHFDGRS